MSVHLETSPPPVRSRDAARTRGQLLRAGLRRFADEGYASTTVRQVADDAGVNVALIKRYFGSKEGLFEACLAAAVDGLRTGTRSTTTAEVAERMAQHATGVGVSGDDAGVRDRAGGEGGAPAEVHALLLLLRSSGDEGVDALRRRVLLQQSEQLARALRPVRGSTSGVLQGHVVEGGSGRDELVRAQVLLATAVGIAVLRSSPGLQPLRSATVEELSNVLNDLLIGATGGVSPEG